MKPATFEYAAPASVEEALALLNEDSRPIAGGQSLVPLLNFRLARPSRLVDLNHIPELDRITTTAAGALRIGAMTRQVALERSKLVVDCWPLLHQAVRHVGHLPIRCRGTVGGSLAHADPAAELPVAFLTLGARFHLRSPGGQRTLEAEDFFFGALTTALDWDELLVEVEVPPLPKGARTAFVEYARVHGDFAIAGVALLVVRGKARIGLLGVERRPILVTSPEDAESAAGCGWKRALVGSLVQRALREATP